MNKNLTRPRRADYGAEGARGYRRLFVVDVENLVGHGAPSASEVAWVRDAVADRLGTAPSDHVVIGCSHCGLLEVGMAWSRVRYVVRSGPDGADLALLDVLNEDLPSRFGEVILASGDGIFTHSAAALAGAGVRVTVVSRRDGLSTQLRMAATDVVLIDAPSARPSSLSRSAA